METENTNNKPRGKVTLIVMISLILAFIVYYSIMSMISPGRKMAEIKNEIGTKSAETSEVDQKIVKDSSYNKLLKERAFLQSLIVMAQTDSIYLTLNLTDSTANIEISGVVVHKAKMSHIEASKILLGDNEYSLL